MVCNGNTAPDSENIHSDELAQQYGFEGGLVQASLYLRI